MKSTLVIFLTALAFVLTGCSVTGPYLTSNPRTEGLYSNEPQFVLDKTVSVTNARIIQTVNPHFGIAVFSSGFLLHEF